ncbi:MAG: molybdopterin-guanine dinucleotide biosynthesis protein B [Reyranellaceae bacterium]
MELDRAIGIVGWSGVGKTTLIERLIPVLAARGLRVSTVKHCHHALALDAPGKDSDRHQQAGAAQTLLIAPSGTVIVQRARRAPPSLERALAALADVDLVLVEGFRDYRFPRIEVWDACADRPPLALVDRGIAAVISDCLVPAAIGLPVFRRDDIAAVGEFALRLLSLHLPVDRAQSA